MSRDDIKNSETNNDDIDALLATLPKELAPQNDLWPQIQSQLTPRQQAEKRWQPFAVAASVVALAVSLSANVVLLGGQAYATHEQTPEKANDMLLASYSPIGGEACINNVATQGDLRVIRENLLIVQTALAQIDSLLQQAPNDAQLQRQQQHLAQQQTRLLGKINTLTL